MFSSIKYSAASVYRAGTVVRSGTERSAEQRKGSMQGDYQAWMDGWMDVSLSCPLFPFFSCLLSSSRSVPWSQCVHRVPPYLRLSALMSPEAGARRSAQTSAELGPPRPSLQPSIHYAANSPQLQPSQLSPTHSHFPSLIFPLTHTHCVGFTCSLSHSDTQSPMSLTFSDHEWGRKLEVVLNTRFTRQTATHLLLKW